MLISIIIPAYNDAKSIEDLVKEVDFVTKKITDSYEILVLDDGSQDETKLVILNLAKRYKKLKVLIHDKNKGYGAALKTLYSNSNGDFIINLPGDNQMPAENISKFMNVPYDQDIVIGYRKKRMDSIRRKMNSFFYNIIISIIAFKRIHDVDSTKRIRKDLIKNINLKYDNVFLDSEIVLRSILKNCKICEITIIHRPRIFGRSSGGKFKTIFIIISSLIKFLFEDKLKR